jgi:hypothetical protein
MVQFHRAGQFPSTDREAVIAEVMANECSLPEFADTYR